MHRIFLLAAYGWLTLFGLAHFLIDVISRRLSQGDELDAHALLFMDHWKPKAVAGIFFVLIAAAALTHER